MVKANGHGPKRAILYARVSTEEQAKTGYSIPEQLRELRAYAARESYRVVEEVVNDGHSGADPHRPGVRRGGGRGGAGGAVEGAGAARARPARGVPAGGA